ncbi:MAG TPA: AI-2E family transporter [Thermoanaerobaculia bacterium]|nr:AI-2E family transporter [Thermoanaerobaculia bacterium]
MASDPSVVTTRRSIPNSLRVMALFLGALVLLLFLWRARSLFLTIFLATVAGVALAHAADWLERHRVRRSVGAPLIMLLIVGSLVGVLAAMAPTVRGQMDDLGREVPKAFRKIEEWLGSAKNAALQAGGQSAQEPQQGTQQPEAEQPGAQQTGSQQAEEPAGGGLQEAGRFLFPVISSTFEALAGVIIIIFVAIYIAVSPHTYRDGIMHLIPHGKRERAAEVLTDVGETLRGWLTARLIAMVVIGIVTGTALALLGVRAALALGFIAGLLELIPFYGPIIAAVPAIGVALVESPRQAVYVAILYIVVQQFEGNLLTPLILKRRLEVPPVLTIVAVSAFGIVFGVVGMLAAEPLLAATLLVIRKLYVRDVIGDPIDE